MELVICVSDGVMYDEAEALARRTGAPLCDREGDGVTVLFDRTGVSLSGYGMKYRGDFTQMLSRIGAGLRQELLIRRAKPRSGGLKAVDAAAGMGEDAFLLAACGYEVSLYEKNAVIAALLRDALRRAESDERLCAITSHMHLTEGDSTELMPTSDLGADLIYLDPMFPPRRKSGLINKKLQLIQKLEQPCGDERALLDAAIAAHPKKIVIKRPLKGAYLADMKPSYSISGKSIRYDCIAFPDAT